MGKRPPHRQTAPKGQTIILVALMFVMLMGFVGLVIDIGRVFIEWGQLRRAVDAASLAAAAQFREGRGIGEMTAVARQMMEVNGVTPTGILVEDCNTDPNLCPSTPPRKFVRITASSEVRMAFLLLLGLDVIPIEAIAVGEAASLDVVLVIDISESMAWDADPDEEMYDPHECNNDDPGGLDGYPGSCHPFQEVKAAADRFVQRILDKAPGEEEDRLAIVTFANGWSADINQGTFYRPNPNTPTWINDRSQARQIIRDLRIYDPPECTWPDGSMKTPMGPCRNYELEDGSYGRYVGFECYSCRDAGDSYDSDTTAWNDIDRNGIDDQEWSYLPTTNIGGALLRAGNMFPDNEATPANEMREDSLWVVILLTDGVANATIRHASDNINRFETYPVGSCPFAEENDFFPICQDKNVTTYHPMTDVARYDADDYARDMADFVGCMGTNPAPGCYVPPPPYTGGQGALIFSIGLGNGVLDTGCRDLYPGRCEVGADGDPTTEDDARAYGAELLGYIAAVGDDGNPNTNPCTGSGWYDDFNCGNYYYSPEGSDLDSVFEDIASRIFTRLHQ
jgi:hypothetical protein